MGCEKVFADYKGTNRQELNMLLVRGGVRKGDTLCVRSLGDLGQGAESTRIRKLVEAKGVKIEILPVEKELKVQGRPKKFAPTPDQKEHLCVLWYSPATLSHVLDRAEDIMGQKVTRDKLYYICGNRDGSNKPKHSKEAE